MIRLLPFVLIIAACIIDTCSQECPCSQETSAAKYCRADYAILARVQNNGWTIGSWRIYKIKILWKIKTNKPWSTIRQTHLYTKRFASKCGVKLTNGKIYFITGTLGPKIGVFSKHSMRTSSCDFQISVFNAARGRRTAGRYRRRRC